MTAATVPPIGDMSTRQVLHDDDALRIVRSRPLVGIDGPLVVVFGCGAPIVRAGFHLPFQRDVALLRCPVLHVIDKSLSYYASNGISVRIVEVIRQEMRLLDQTEVITIGHSLGAFGAIAFAEHVPVRFALSLAPRFTPDYGILRDHRLAGLLHE